MYRRTYVSVTAQFDECGGILPLSLTLHGQRYAIDRVLDRRNAAALKAGGQGMRYTVRICGQETYLFQDERQRWFVEEKDDVRQISADG